MKRFLESRNIQPWQLVTAVLLIVLIALVLSGCGTDTTQNTFDAKGEVARRQRDLFYMAMWPAIGVMILVEGLVVIIMLRFRRRRQDEMPKQTHGNTRLELAWTIAPALLLLGLAVPMVTAIFDLGRAPSADAMQINVTGQQWAWSFEYPDIKDSSGTPVNVLGELHVPVNTEVAFNLHSIDVIHSFWIPKLGGKLDVIPNEDNRFWLKGDEPGSYSGQCVEFCGLGHADMKMIIHVDSESDFQKWVNEQTGAGQAAGSPTPGATPPPAAGSPTPGASASPAASPAGS